MRLGPYEVLDTIGRGGMGHVVRARHTPTGAIRVVKVLSSGLDPESIARFRREAEVVARLPATDVVSVHDTGVEGRTFWFAMALMPGGSLRSRLHAAGGRLPWRDAVALVASIARALGRCHAAGLVHRDLKPENVLFDEEGRPRLSDWGCVRALGASRLTETGTVLGTPAYMPPEQLQGRAVGPAADVFALGVVLFEAATGFRPFDGEHLLDLERAIVARRRPRLTEQAGAPRALDALLDRILDPDPSRRPRDGAALAAELEVLLPGAAREKKTAKPSARAGIALAALVALGASAVVAARGLPRTGAASGPEHVAATRTAATAPPATGSAVAAPRTAMTPEARAKAQERAAKLLRGAIDRLDHQNDARESTEIGRKIREAYESARDSGLDVEPELRTRLMKGLVSDAYVLNQSDDFVHGLELAETAVEFGTPADAAELLTAARFLMRPATTPAQHELIIERCLELGRVDTDPDRRGLAYATVCLCHEARKRLDRAVEALSEGIALLGSSSRELEFHRVYVLRTAGRHDEVLRYSEDLVARFDAAGDWNRSTDVILERVESLVDLGRVNDAAKELERVAKSQRGGYNYYSRSLLVQVALGDRTAAIDCLEKAWDAARRDDVRSGLETYARQHGLPVPQR